MSKPRLHYLPPREEYTACGRSRWDVENFTRSDAEMAADCDLTEACRACVRKLGPTRRQAALLASGMTRRERSAAVSPPSEDAPISRQDARRDADRAPECAKTP